MNFIRVPLYLDSAPAERWIPVMKSPLLKPAIKVMSHFLKSLELILKQKKMLEFPIRHFAKRYKTILHIHYPEYLEEMLYLCRFFECSCSVYILLQFIFELGASCTSIIFPNPADNGSLCHFRTLDWQVKLLKKTTFCLDVSKKGQLLYSNVTFVGYLGTFTSTKHNHFSVSLNYRPIQKLSVWTILRNLFRPLQGQYQLNGFALRKALEEQLPFDSFVEYLRTVPLCAACYLMVVGSEEGVRLVRSYDSTFCYSYDPYKEWGVDYLYSYQDFCLTKVKRWGNLVQTNMDPLEYEWLKNRAYEFRKEGVLLSYSRIQWAEKVLADPKKDLTTTIQDLLQYPIVNQQSIFWCVFQAQQGLFIGSIF